MSNSNDSLLTVDTAEKYFYDLSLELKKEYGRGKAFELIVVGGAAIMLNYDFRGSTTDVDGYISMGGSIKDAILRVAEKHGISDAWLNSDFKKTKSFSNKLTQFSKFYKTYNQSLIVRTITGEHLIAMKLVSFRPYKRDRSDILGILENHSRMGKPLSYDKIDKAVCDLYGGWTSITQEAQDYIKTAVSTDTYDYNAEFVKEDENKELLIDFEKEYQDVITEENLNTVLEAIKNRKNTAISTESKPRIPKL